MLCISDVRVCVQCLIECRQCVCERLKLDTDAVELSMGMSSDFEHAVSILVKSYPWSENQIMVRVSR